MDSLRPKIQVFEGGIGKKNREIYYGEGDFNLN
jgi:hypothetical protein